MSQGPVHGSCSEPPIFAQAAHSMHPTIALQEVHVTHVSSLIDWEAERVLSTWARIPLDISFLWIDFRWHPYWNCCLLHQSCTACCLLQADVVFLSPPWGGPVYQKQPLFHVAPALGPMAASLADMVVACQRAITALPADPAADAAVGAPDGALPPCKAAAPPAGRAADATASAAPCGKGGATPSAIPVSQQIGEGDSGSGSSGSCPANEQQQQQGQLGSGGSPAAEQERAVQLVRHGQSSFRPGGTAQQASRSCDPRGRRASCPGRNESRSHWELALSRPSTMLSCHHVFCIR